MTARLAACLFAVAATAATAAAEMVPGWKDDRAFLLALRSRGVLCQPEEACVNRVCASDGATACTRTIDCPQCLTVENRDVAMCRPISLGENQTSCRWSLFFDGTRAGLNGAIRALEILPDGSLLLRTGADNAIPDISGSNRRDLVRFVPTDAAGRPGRSALPYTRGRWSLFLDGRAVLASSEARLMDGIALLPNSCRDVNDDGRIDFQECDILFSSTAGGTLAGMSIETEDIIRCRPTQLSPGGTVVACEYAIFYQAGEVNDPTPNDGVSQGLPGSWTSGGTHSFAVLDFNPDAMHAALVFAAGNVSTLPKHQVSRDLLLNIGHVGPFGTCEVDDPIYCLSASDCPAHASCYHWWNPGTDTLQTHLLFQGSDVLGGEMIAAVAIVGDRDGDGVPDPIDNCPDDYNPPVCSDSGAACQSADDCGEGESCHQPDGDGDGIGDACDACDGRHDSSCSCGDFVVDAPGEQCDLGAPEFGGHNGLEGSPCTADCRITGVCTRSGAVCGDAIDCPEYATGEGCCGNGVVDSLVGGDEDCDDGNAIDDDGCSNECRVVANGVPLPQECEGLIGPRVVPTFVRTLRFQKQIRKVAADAEPENYSRWGTRGEFSLVPGIDFDPDSQRVELIFNQGASVCDGGAKHGSACSRAADCPQGRCGAALYRATLDAGAFVQGGMRQDRPRWTFADRTGTTPGAPAWTNGRFAQRLATLRRPLNQVRFSLQGRGHHLEPPMSLHIDATALGGPPTRVRQTIVIGDLCTTQILTCEETPTGRSLQCYSQVE